MDRSRIQNRFDHPVAWGVLASISFLIYKKFDCMITDCGGGLSTLALFILFVWALIMYSFIPTITLISNGIHKIIGLHGCRQVTFGACGGLVLFTLLEAWHTVGLCMVENRCDPQKGFPESMFKLIQDFGWQHCGGYGLCYTAVRNAQWPLIALMSALLNHFLETSWLISTSCSDQGSNAIQTQRTQRHNHQGPLPNYEFVRTEITLRFSRLMNDLGDLYPEHRDVFRRISNHVLRRQP